MNNKLRKAALIAAGLVSAGSVAAEEATSTVMTALSSTTISGYVSSSALFDLSGTTGPIQLPGRTFDGPNKIDQFNLDVVKLTVEKPVGDGDWSAGYKADLLFGPDANTFGTSSILGANSQSDFTIKQAYVAVNAPVGNGLVAKMGVFDTIIGYEVFEAGNNPNYSRAYSYYIQPFQHTGLLLSYQATEVLALNAGIANAWDTRINAPGAEPGSTKDFGIQTYMASMGLTAPESMGFLQGSTLYAGVVHGLSSIEGNDGDPRTSLYAGVTIPSPIENLAVGIAYDYRFSERSRIPADNASEYATTIGGYLSYQFTRQLKLNLRGEYAKGSAGTWGAQTPGVGTGEEYFGATASLDIGLWENVLTRLEFRWDNDLSDAGGSFGSTTNPKDNAYILGLNVIYKF